MMGVHIKIRNPPHVLCKSSCCGSLCVFCMFCETVRGVPARTRCGGSDFQESEKVPQGSAVIATRKPREESNPELWFDVRIRQGPRIRVNGKKAGDLEQTVIRLLCGVA